jgi:biotin-[acetyl-CoA-carboxylase] ligase BirA-like protein
MSEVTFDLSETTARLCKRPSFGWDYVGFEEIDSTNEYSKKHAFDFQKPTLIVAKHQTEGKGRGGKVWEDDGPGKSFLSTWCIELIEGPANPRWTLGLGLYLYESLSEAFKTVRFSLKEPNDIYIGDRKVAGVLAEATSEGELHYLHVGVGINVFSYPANHSASATHLNAYLGTASLTPETWAQFLDYFGTRLLHFEKRAVTAPNGWLSRLSPRLVSALNKHPSHQENPVQAVTPEGNIQLEKGEISWQQL